MADKDMTDDIITKTCQENKDDFKAFAPDFSRIEKGVLQKLNQRRTQRKWKRLLRVSIAAAAAFILLNTFLIFADFEPVKAYQAEVKKFVFNITNDKQNSDIEVQIVRSSTEISKVQKMVPYSIPVPSWIPDDYTFDSVQIANDGNHVTYVTIKYNGPADQLVMKISNDASISTTFPEYDEGSYEKLDINGNQVYISVIKRDNGSRIKCTCYNDQGLNIFISGAIDKQSLIKFLESMK